VGDLALEVNDSTGHGDGNENTAVGAQALQNNVDGSDNTGVGAGVGPNITNGFNNTYIGQHVGDNSGTPIPNEDLTIRIADFSIDGFGSAECYIGGIFNNMQPTNGSNIVEVTIDLNNDHLGWSPAPGSAPFVPYRTAPQPRGRPQLGHQAMLNMLNPQIGHQAVLNNKVEKLQATVAQQQKQIETLTTQLREQAAQIEKVSAQVELIKPAPRVVENR
jgi:hypothetical protein